MRPNGTPGPVLRPLGGPRRGLSGIIRQFIRDYLKKARDRRKCECKRPEYGEKRLLALRRSLGEPTFDARRDFSDSLWKAYSQKFGTLWLASVVGLDIMNVRTPLRRGFGQVKQGMRHRRIRNLPSTWVN